MGDVPVARANAMCKEVNPALGLNRTHNMLGALLGMLINRPWVRRIGACSCNPFDRLFYHAADLIRPLPHE